MAAFLQRPVLVFSPQDRDEKGQLIPVRYMVNDTGKVYLPDTSTKEKEAALFADTSIPDNALILVYNGTNHWDAASRDLAP